MRGAAPRYVANTLRGQRDRSWGSNDVLCFSIGRGPCRLSALVIMSNCITMVTLVSPCFIAVCTKVGAADFSDIFFDHSYILASDLLDIERLNNLTDFVNSYGVMLVWVRTFR